MFKNKSALYFHLYLEEVMLSQRKYSHHHITHSLDSIHNAHYVCLHFLLFPVRLHFVLQVAVLNIL